MPDTIVLIPMFALLTEHVQHQKLVHAQLDIQDFIAVSQFALASMVQVLLFAIHMDLVQTQILALVLRDILTLSVLLQSVSVSMLLIHWHALVTELVLLLTFAHVKQTMRVLNVTSTDVVEC